MGLKGLKIENKMVNNTEQIRNMLSFGPDDFYFVEVIKRRKDNPDLSRSEKVIRNFYIESFENYDKLIPTIIKLSDFENARAYIRANKRNYKKLALPILKRVTDYLISGNEKSIRTVFDSVAGETHSDADKKWIVDVDGVWYITPSETLNTFLTVLQLEAERTPMIEIVPTKSGYHIVTRPFNLQKFKEVYGGIDVHKDNMLILYCP